MYPSGFDYIAPSTKPEVLDVLGGARERKGEDPRRRAVPSSR